MEVVSACAFSLPGSRRSVGFRAVFDRPGLRQLRAGGPFRCVRRVPRSFGNIHGIGGSPGCRSCLGDLRLRGRGSRLRRTCSEARRRQRPVTPIDLRSPESSGTIQARPDIAPRVEVTQRGRGKVRVGGRFCNEPGRRKPILSGGVAGCYSRPSGLIRRRTAVTRSAGMPVLRACSRMLSSSGARYTQ